MLIFNNTAAPDKFRRQGFTAWKEVTENHT